MRPARAESWAEPASQFWAGLRVRLGRTVAGVLSPKRRSLFHFYFPEKFLLPRKLKMQIGSKEIIEKIFFPVGKIQEIEYMFSAAKEKVYSLVILNRRDI